MTTSSPAASAGSAPGPILSASPGFTAWLAAQQVGLVLSTYQRARLIFVGRRPDGGLRGHERLLEHCQGLWSDGQTLWASSKTMLWRFRNTLSPGGTTPHGADRVFAPREARVTGALDIHDIAVGRMPGMDAPAPIFVATAWNCLATLSETGTFRPLWRPRFVSALIAEDRCHLNGLAMRDGAPAYVTAVAPSNVLDGWRERRTGGGVLVDVESGETVTTGLSMPHSPRLGPDGRVWLLNSGTGELGWVDPRDGRFTATAFLPGFARGLALVGGYAVVGLSRPRHNLTFEGLPLAEALARNGALPRCGLVVVELATGRTAEWLRFEHTIEELYDVAALPGVAQPEATGLKPADLEQAAMPDESGGLLPLA
jgi:uncharacterized protein (TIGR03032 family)